MQSERGQLIATGEQAIEARPGIGVRPPLVGGIRDPGLPG